MSFERSRERWAKMERVGGAGSAEGSDLAGRVFAVVGGGSGIGRALSGLLVCRGARVGVIGRREAVVSEAVGWLGGLACEVAERPGVGFSVIGVPTDVSSFEGAESAIAEVVGWGGRLDGVFNGAGSILLKPAHLTSEAELLDTFRQNVTSAFGLLRASVKPMREGGGGSVVLMSSTAARVGLVNHEAIAAAKAGVVGLVMSAAATYADAGVRVNAIAPGLVDTPMASRLTSSEASRKASESMHPLGRIGRAEEVAKVAAWLLGDDSSWVTGQVIGIDGGLSTVRGRPRG